MDYYNKIKKLNKNLTSYLNHRFFCEHYSIIKKKTQMSYSGCGNVLNKYISYQMPKSFFEKPITSNFLLSV